MHLMIDLETLGTSTDCVVTQIGYCVFDMDQDQIFFQDEIHLDPQDQINMGRKIDWKTLQWWHKQTLEARCNLPSKKCTVSMAMLNSEISAIYATTWGD